MASLPMMTCSRSKGTTTSSSANITVRFNDKGEVIDVHRVLELELELALIPYTEPGYRIKLDGVVAEITSGQVFVKTPVGRDNLNAKTAP